MKPVHVRSYIRKGKRVRNYTRKNRPIGKRRILGHEKFTQVRDEYGHVLGFRIIKRRGGAK